MGGLSYVSQSKTVSHLECRLLQYGISLTGGQVACNYQITLCSTDGLHFRRYQERVTTTVKALVSTIRAVT